MTSITRFDSLESTNKYCEALDLAEVEDFTCFWALEQTAGIGQRGNHWDSEPNKNLTFSLVLHPSFLPADRQFKLTEALSLALVDFLQQILSGSPSKLEGVAEGRGRVFIKWPNDIYVEGRKICGTLVSTRLQGTQIASVICGIGVNVNQTVFPDWVPNPTSISLLSGEHYELELLLKDLLCCIEKRYKALASGQDPEPEYLTHLLNLGSRARYIYNEKEIVATITGIDEYGHLLLSADDGCKLCCSMKEIALATVHA